MRTDINISHKFWIPSKENNTDFLGTDEIFFDW
jgi:hypothetical protein